MLLLAGTMAAAAALLAHPAAAASPASAQAPTLLALRAAAADERVYVTSTGESVRIAVSDALVANDEDNQQWAEFLARLPHGPELSDLLLYFAPPAEVHVICGANALACYSPSQRRAVAPSQEIPGQPSRQSLLAHEYGHHVANSRSNPPWPGVAFGPKRWASYVNVCAGLEEGTFSRRQYELDPAEGFAEAYRVLAELRLGLEPSPWEIVDRAFEPDETALALIEQDIVDPWQRNVVLQLKGARSRTIRFSTPLDGRVTFTLRAPRTSVYQLRVPGAPLRLARGRGKAQVSTTVCGRRQGAVTVRLLRGKGRFQLAISRP